MGINGLTWDFMVCQWELLPNADIIQRKNGTKSGLERSGAELYSRKWGCHVTRVDRHYGEIWSGFWFFYEKTG